MRSSLDVPDREGWHALPNYSPAVAERLERAYAWIARGGDRAGTYLRAANEVAPYLARRIAAPQRLRVLYVEALAYAAVARGDEALEWAAAAVELAEDLDDWSALAAVLYLRGALDTALLRFGEGAADYEDSRRLLRLLGAGGARRDIASELHLTVWQANLRFFMGEYEAAERLIGEAYGLLTPCPGEPRACCEPRERLAIAWVEANLFRWRGEPERGLRRAAQAAAYVTASGPADSAARIQTVAADVALDLAAAFPSGSDREAMLQLAGPHIADALRLAGEVRDEPGVAQARLAQLRCLRLGKAGGDRLGVIEGLERTARRLGDLALRVQILTARGDELADRGEAEAARASYQEALDAAYGIDLRALGVWAWRALYRPGGSPPGAW